MKKHLTHKKNYLPEITGKLYSLNPSIQPASQPSDPHHHYYIVVFVVFFVINLVEKLIFIQW